MKRTRLTQKLKETLRTKYYRERVHDYTGPAREYLREQKRLARLRTKENAKVLKVGGTVIPQNSEMYHIVAESARLKGQTVRRYAKENEAAIDRLATSGTLYFTREVDYLVDDVKEAAAVFISSRSVGDDKKTSKTKAKYYLLNFKQYLVNTGLVYDSILVEHSYDLKGNLFFDYPLPSEYEENEDGESILEYIDRFYPNIIYYRNDTEETDFTDA